MGKEQTVASAIGAVALPIFEFLYGEGTAVMGAVIAVAFFIGMDWLSGSAASRKDKTYASHYGIDGVFRTFFMLLLPAGGHFLDNIMSSPGILFGILVAGLLHHTIKSMTANAIRAGWADWLPVGILEKVTVWVESEIESKIDRAFKRQIDRNSSH
ncbi:phage holin family protein [Cohnella panacarvi]|uniref:phage holin family protein n=1 Tax=Cohnella panacarvi TaxID=400776 RepID=UPI0004AD449A|nr:phage holin family protein [Cohnella panacarvi]